MNPLNILNGIRAAAKWLKTPDLTFIQIEDDTWEVHDDVEGYLGTVVTDNIEPYVNGSIKPECCED